jgi:hypothetical protein
MRAALVYERGEHVYVTSESQTLDEFWIASPPFIVRESADLDDEELARLVLAALAESEQRVPTPPAATNPLSPVLRLAGVKSFAEFMRGAKAVRASAVDLEIEITPMRNAGARGGFELLEKKSIHASSSPVRLSRALAAARALAE